MKLFLATACAVALALPATVANAQDGAPPAPPSTENSGDPKIPADTEIVTTESGLKYSVIKKGAEGAAQAKAGDAVTVHYTGWTTDGKVFDSSRRRGKPMTFMCGGPLIDGWNEALPLMKVGEQFKLTIPPELGYGERGSPPSIPGGATLIFELELISLRSAPAFTVLDDEKATEHATGFRYQVLDPGDGDGPTAEETCVFHVVLWNHEGKPMESSYVQPEPIKAPLSALRLAAIRDAAMLIKPGGAIQCELPGESVYNGRAPAGTPKDAKVYLHVALFKVIKPLPVPDFVMPKDEELEVKESGLKVQVVEPGREDGKSPKMGEFVTVHYAGWLTDGKPFDASFKRGEPTSFQLGAVIPGWNEGLQLMKEGATYRFVIPANLAYGARATGAIPPNSTLVFLVKLIKVGKDD